MYIYIRVNKTNIQIVMLHDIHSIQIFLSSQCCGKLKLFWVIF